MPRFTDHNADDYTKEQYKAMATYYSAVIGLLLSKTGPMQITTEDIWCYQLAKLSPVMHADNDSDGFKVFLVGEDENPEDLPLAAM
jgi:hypothetical protein